MRIDADDTTIPYREVLRAVGWHLDMRARAAIRLDVWGKALALEARSVARPRHIERAPVTLPALPLILMSTVALRLFPAAPIVFLPKPFDLDGLIVLIRRLLHRA